MIKSPTIVRKDPPAAAERLMRTKEADLRALDTQILRHLTEPQRPVEVAEMISVKTHRVATRLRVLRQRGQVERIKPFGGPNNGPGAALYQAIPA